jgi:hypothetical protein
MERYDPRQIREGGDNCSPSTPATARLEDHKNKGNTSICLASMPTISTQMGSYGRVDSGFIRKQAAQ